MPRVKVRATAACKLALCSAIMALERHFWPTIEQHTRKLVRQCFILRSGHGISIKARITIHGYIKGFVIDDDGAPFKWLCTPSTITGMARNIANLAMKATLRKHLPPATFPRTFRICLSSQPRNSEEYEYIGGLKFWPAYFNAEEQKILLKASLHKLDSNESIRSRKRRRAYLRTLPVKASRPDDIQNFFLPDDYYEFQEV